MIIPTLTRAMLRVQNFLGIQVGINFCSTKKEVITFIISQLQHVILTLEKFFSKFCVVKLKKNYSVVPDYK